MTRGDRTIVVAILVAVLVSIPVAIAWAGTGSSVATIVGPSGETRVDLADNACYEVEGREGIVMFEVRDGCLLCVSSTCDDQVCVNQGRVSIGRPVVCAPNGVVAFAAPTRRGQEALDAVSR